MTVVNMIRCRSGLFDRAVGICLWRKSTVNHGEYPLRLFLNYASAAGVA